MALPGFGGGGLGGGLGGVRNIARAGVSIQPDTSNFERTLSGNLKRIVTQVGAAAAGAFGAVFAAGAGAAIAGAVQFASFEQSLARIRGLVGVAEEELQGMEQAILRIGPAVGKGPQELVDALFFITSAGLRGEVALEALEASAKASAAGLGETSVIADALTSAINAYGEENLSATEATNALVGAVREGKLEADSLASVVGRVVPLASAMGIEFNEVTAALAAMSRTGLDANEAATALRGIMSTLLKPTAEAEALFTEFGTSIGDIRSTIREEGLFAGLLDLQAVIGDNEDAFGDVIPNVRALSGFLNLLGENADENRAIFEALAGNTDFLGEAFDAAADTGAFKFQQALAELQVVLLDLGRDVLPAFVEILNKLVPVFREQLLPALKFTADAFVNVLTGASQVLTFLLNLPAPVKAATVAVGGLAAAFTIIQFNPIIRGLTIVAGVFALIGRRARENQGEINRFKDALEAAASAAEGTEEAGAVFFELADRLASSGAIDLIEQLGLNVEDVVGVVLEGRDALDEFILSIIESGERSREDIEAFRALSIILGDVERDYRKANEQIEESVTLSERAKEGTDDLTRAEVELLQALGLLVPVWDTQARTVRLVTEAERDAILAARDLAGANEDVEESAEDVVPPLEEEKDTLEDLRVEAEAAADAIRDVTNANLEALNPSLRLFRALQTLAEAEDTFDGLKIGAEGYDEALLGLLEAEAQVQAAQGVFILEFEDTKEAFFELAEAVGVPTAAAEALFQTLIDEPTRNQQAIEDAFGGVAAAIRQGVLSPIPAIAEAAKADLQAKLAEADFSSINIPGVTLGVDVRLIPNFDTSQFDVPRFGSPGGNIPEGSNPTTNNTFNTTVNNPEPEPASTSIESTVLDPAIQRALNRRQ